MEYLALRAHTGTFLGVRNDYIGTVEASSPHLTLATVFERVPVTGDHFRLRPLGTEYELRAVGNDYRLFVAYGWPQNGSKLSMRDQGGSKVALSVDYGGYFCVEPDGRVVADRHAIGSWEMFELIDCDDTVAGWKAQENCCGIAHTSDETIRAAERPIWDDEAHRWLVRQSFEILTRVSDQKNVGNLLALWNLEIDKQKPFQQQVFKGLYDADHVLWYIGFVYDSHFYDPDTKGTWTLSHRNALTECTRFARDAFLILDSRKWQCSSTADLEAVKRAGFQLGLALHYFTDLTQPMHAANFPIIVPSFVPWDLRHSTFETLAEQEHTKYTLKPEDVDPAEIVKLMAKRLEPVVVATARFSKGVFKAHVRPRAEAKVTYAPGAWYPTIDNHWSVEETIDAFRESFTYAQKAVPAFLATVAGLSGLLSAPRTIGAHPVRQPPSFFESNGEAYILFAEDDFLNFTQLVFSKFDRSSNDFSSTMGAVYNQNWNRQYQSAETPAAVALDDVLYAAWHQRDTNDIYFSHSQPGDWAYWSEPRRISDRVHIQDSTAPVLVEYRRRLVAIWQDDGTKASGEGERRGIYYCIYDPAIGRWLEPVKIPGMCASRTPTVSVFDDRLFAAWCGLEVGGPVYSSSFDSKGGWVPQVRLPDGIASSEPPSLVVASNVMHLFWRSNEGDEIRVIKTSDGKAWDNRDKIEIPSRKGVGAGAAGNRIFVGWTLQEQCKYVCEES